MSSGGEAVFVVGVELGDIAQGSQKAQHAVDDVRKSAKSLDDALEGIRKHTKTTFSGLAASLKGSEGAFTGAHVKITQLERDIASLRKTFSARIDSFKALGIDPKNLALLENQLEKLLVIQRQVHRESAAGTLTGDRLKGHDLGFQAIRKGVTAENAQIQSLIKNLTSQQTAAARAQQSIANLGGELQKIAARAQANQAKAAAKGAASALGATTQGAEQRAVIATRVAGQQRVAITRAFLDTIGRLEKALGTVVAGVARTTVGAISKIYSGTVGSLQRSFSERHNVISGGLRNETRLFTQAAAVQQKARSGVLGIGLRQAAFIGGGAGLIGALKSTFTLGADFNQGLRVLQASLELTDDQMKVVRKSAIDLGNDITLPGVSALDAATGIQLLAKQFSSLGPAAITAATAASKGALQLQIATGATAEDAARLVGSAVNVFHIAADEATQVADQITQAVSKSAGISVTDFAQAFTQASTVFEQFVGPAETAQDTLIDFNTALAALAKGGLIGSDAGTSLRSFFIQANRGTDDANQALAEVSARAGETGTAFFTASGEARPFVDTLNILRRGLEGLTTEQKANTLQTIFGTDAIRSASILLDQNGFEYQKLRDQIAASTGAAARFADAQSGGLRRAFDAISSSIETLQIQLFGFADKALGPVALRLAELFGSLISGTGVFETIRRGLLGVAAGLAAVVAVKVGVEVLGLLAKVLPLLLTPFGVLSILAAGLGAAFVIASKNSKGFADALSGMRDMAITAAKFLRDKLGDALSFIGEKLRPLLTFVPIIQRIADAFAGFGNNIQRAGLATALHIIFLRLKNIAADVLPGLIRRFPILGTVIDTVRHAIDNLAPAFRRIREFGAVFQNAFASFKADGLLAGLKTLGASLKNVLIADFKNIDFGEIGRLISTSLGRALTGAGIGAVAGGLIAGPIGAALGAALGGAIGLALPKIRSAIGRIDWGSLFGKLLDAVRIVGRKIGEILSDKRTILAVAGIAAAAAALAVQFIQGFVSGILSNLGDIADAGAAILNALFAQNSMVKAIVALAIIFRKQLFGLIAPIFRKAGQDGGKALAQGVTEGVAQGGLKARITAALQKAGVPQAFANVGKAAAAGLTSALSAGLSGSALGGASNNLEKGLGIAGIAASAAQAFAAGSMVNPGVGAALAAGTVGVGLLTAALANNAKKAAEAKARMMEYVDAVRSAGEAGTDTSTAIQEVFAQHLKDASNDVIEGFHGAGVSIDELNTAVANSDPAAVLADLNDELDRLEGTAVRGADGMMHIYDPAVVAQIGDTKDAIKFVKKEIVATSDAADRLKLEDSLDPGKNFSTFENRVAAMPAALDRATAAKKKLLEETRTATLTTTLENIRSRTEKIGTAADTARAKILELVNGPQAKTAKAGGAEAAVGVEGVATSLTDAFASDVGETLKSAKVENAFATLTPVLSSAVQDGLGNAFSPEEIKANLGTVRSVINELVTPDGAAVSQEVKDMLLGGVDRFEADVVPAVIPLDAKADADDAKLKGLEILRAATQAVLDGQPVPILSAADRLLAGIAGTDIFSVANAAAGFTPVTVYSYGDPTTATTTGTDIFNRADAAALAAGTVTVPTASDAVAAALAGAQTFAEADAAAKAAGSIKPLVTSDSVAASTAGSQTATTAISAATTTARGGAGAIGRAIGDGAAAGVNSRAASLKAAAVAAVTNAINAAKAAAGIASPSKVFMGIGQDMMEGLALGIRDESDNVSSEIDSIVDKIINATDALARGMREGVGKLFTGLFDEFARTSGADSGQAVEKFSGSMRSVIEQVTSNAEALWAAASKEAGQQTLSDRLLIQESFTSLRPGDEFGAANRDAIRTAVDSIKDIGSALLEQGYSADQAAAALATYRSQLLFAAASAGLASGEVDAFLDTLGLSAGGLAGFVGQATRLQQIIEEGKRQAGANQAPPLVPGPNAVTNFNISNEFQTPFDDPEAVSLAVVNRLAQSIRR